MIEDQREQSYLKGRDMDELKDRLTRIEQLGSDGHVAQKVIESSFQTHAIQNEKDFQHVDECMHRADADSKARDEAILRQISELRTEFDQVKTWVLKASGALLVLVPVVNQLLGKFL